MARVKQTIRLPDVKLPRLATAPRNPPGWNVTELSFRTTGARYANRFKKPEPAGDPPDSFAGSRAEWAIDWALRARNMEEGVDYHFRAPIPGVGYGGYNQVDFLFPHLFLIIEVQGLYWHYNSGGGLRAFEDLQRAAEIQSRGYNVIFIDEDHALGDPIYYVEEALKGNDHSRTTGRIAVWH